jgi:hypothetical protein
MNRLILTLLILYFSLNSLYCQNPYVPMNTYNNPAFNGPMIDDEEVYYNGYILTKTDTIKCLVEEYNQKYGDAYVFYKLAPDDRNTLDIAYRDIIEVFDNTYYYDIVNIQNRLVLLRRLCEGTVTLYEWEKTIDTSFGPKTKTKYYLKKSDKIIKISKSTFKEDLKTAFSENLEILNEINNMDYEVVCSNLKSLVNKYNDWIKKQ